MCCTRWYPKLLAKRLKSCSDKCVSVDQLAFVEGVSMLNNVLIATKIIKVMKRNFKGGEGS